MGQNNPLSFKGRIGRGRFWLTLILVSITQVIFGVLLGVSERHIVFGAASVSYATAESWNKLALYYPVVAVLGWVTLAAFVKRLRDLNRSIKWLAAAFGGMVVVVAFEAIISSLHWDFPVLEMIPIILVVPVIIPAVWNMFEALIFPAAAANPMPEAAVQRTVVSDRLTAD
jgi:uncharacterized membrane protein YhaH (DUF805 family)